MTAAASWESAGETFPPEITSALNSSGDADLIDLKLLAAIPEWEVRLSGGETASQTDVLALARNERGLCVIAVEAKVDEDFGPLLSERRTEVSLGQGNRLDELHKLLGVASMDGSIRYQFLHRTASAILTAREFHAHVAVMLVHSFGSKASLRSDFAAFCTALRTRKLPGDICEAPFPKQPRLLIAWCDGDKKFLEANLPSVM